MSQPVLIGIDSGGTRTNVEARTSGGEDAVFRYEVGEVLSDAVHYTDFVPVLRHILAPMEMHWHSCGLSASPAFLFLSSAGFYAGSREDYLRALNEVTCDLLGGSVKAFGAANDAATLLIGSDTDGVVIAGTGSNVLIRSQDGRLHQSGGLGWVASDEGSGFWIGLKGIRQACQDLEDDVESVILLRLRQLYGIRKQDRRELTTRFLDLCIADHGMLGEIARFASSVCAAAERGDQVAQNIVKAEAEKLADSTARAIRRHFDPSRLAEGVSVVECGGLLCNDFYRAAFETQVEMRMLSSQSQAARISWTAVNTGLDAAINLAQRVAEQRDELMNVELDYRPVVVRNT